MLHHMSRISANQPFYVYNTQTSDTTDASSYTFTNVAISTASANRLVVVVVGTGFSTGGASDQFVSSVTIGGVPATIAVQSQSFNTVAGGFGTTAIAYANIPTGTTASIVVTTQIGALRCNVATYSLYNLLRYTPISTDGFTGSVGNSTNTNTNTDQVTTEIGSIVISGAQSTSPTTGSDYAWTGLDEDFDIVLETARRYSAASRKVNQKTTYSVTATRTGVTPNYFNMATASWR